MSELIKDNAVSAETTEAMCCPGPIRRRQSSPRIALISSSLAEARAVMVEGESGLLAVCRPGFKPIYEPSLHRLRFASGAQAQLFFAQMPKREVARDDGRRNWPAINAAAERALLGSFG